MPLFHDYRAALRAWLQDDGHIFCRKDQIKAEVLGALNFMKFVYDTFGMTYKLELSTRPAKVIAHKGHERGRATCVVGETR